MIDLPAADALICQLEVPVATLIHAARAFDGFFCINLAPALEVRCIRVTDPVVAKSTAFRFADDYRGMETIARAGTVIATDGALQIVTPYDNCVLLQPSLRHLAPGVTVVRLGRLEGPA